MKRRVISAMLLTAAIISMLPAAAKAATSGTSGKTQWVFSNNIIVFSGDGATGTHSYDDVPWSITDTSGATSSLSLEKVIRTAEEELRYVEKRSNSSLYEKRANSGNKNYTKYAADLYPSLQANAWCDMFVGWCFWKAAGKNKTVANKALCGGLGSAYTPTSAGKYKAAGRWSTSSPKVGDQIFFQNGTRICHTGIVYKVTDTAVYTIEGNTLNQRSSYDNGGEVLRKMYSRSFWKIAGYGHPIFSQATTQNIPLTISKVVFKEGVTKLGGYLFTQRSDIKKVYIPKSVTEISSYAFSYCSGITDVYYAGTEAEWKQVKLGGIGNYYIEHASMHYESSAKEEDTDIVDSLNKGSNTLEILNQPTSITVEGNKLHKFSIITNSSDAAYSWEVSEDSGKTWRKFSEKWTAKTANLYFTVTPDMNGWKFRCVVSSGSKSVTSKPFKVSIKTSLKVLLQPKSVSAKVGEPVIFKTKVNQSAKYQWQYKTDNSKKWKNVTAFKTCGSPEMTMKAKAKYNGWSFRCKITAGNEVVYTKIVNVNFE